MQDGKGARHMQITDVRVRRVAKEGKLKAVVSITMDEEFVVHDMKEKKGSLSQCRAKKLWMENIEILRIRSILIQESEFKVPYWKNMRKH